MLPKDVPAKQRPVARARFFLKYLAASKTPGVMHKLHPMPEKYNIFPNFHYWYSKKLPNLEKIPKRNPKVKIR